MVNWGYNRAFYTTSNIFIKGDTNVNGFNFNLTRFAFVMSRF